MPSTTVRAPITSGQRELNVNTPRLRITPAIVSAVRWLHGDTAADELIRKATAR